MKTKKINYLVLLVSILLVSCEKKQNQETERVLTEKLSAVSVKVAQEYSRNEANINLPSRDLQYANYKSLKDEDKGKIRAVAYRFYKHVRMENGRLSTDVKSGSEINISDDLFDFLNKNLNQSNKFLDSLNQKGIKVKPPQISEEYLNSLISN